MPCGSKSSATLVSSQDRPGGEKWQLVRYDYTTGKPSATSLISVRPGGDAKTRREKILCKLDVIAEHYVFEVLADNLILGIDPPWSNADGRAEHPPQVAWIIGTKAATLDVPEDAYQLLRLVADWITEQSYNRPQLAAFLNVTTKETSDFITWWSNLNETPRVIDPANIADVREIIFGEPRTMWEL